MRSDVVFCSPLRLEQRAVTRGRDGLPAPSVVRTGMGPRRANRALASPELARASAVGVVGLAGALDSRLAPGDLVVADEVRAPDGSVTRLRSAPLVAGALRRAGLRCWTGPVAASTRLVDGRARDALAETGALAVDMESAWLVDPDRPGLVVRVVSDTGADPLLSAATVGTVRTALRVLPRVTPTLRAWADAVGPREVVLAEPRSFCAGVDRAIQVVEQALEQRGAPVYVRKQIVHNRHVVADLQDRGAVFVEELGEVPSGATVVFSAHGVSPQVRDDADARGLDVIDATCPLVTKVHNEVRRFGDRGDTVVFIGHAGHEETEGTMGERPERTVLVETVDDVPEVDVPDPERVSYLVQTTLSEHEVSGIVAALEQRFPALKAPPTDDICYATTNRQDALAAVAGETDLVLVLGSQNSSNSRRLVETAERLGTPAHLVDDVHDVDLSWLAGARRVGVSAGASAPSALVDEVVEALAGLGPVRTRTHRVVTENVRFTLPKEVRTA
jgi:4-hydroxy-3-methylbut-2-enyl diphosphate reductase